MRAPIALEAHPSRIWRGAIAVVLLVTGATVGAWCLTSGDVVAASMRACVAIGAIVLGVCVVRLAASAPVGLRWTGATWELLSTRNGEPVRGTATVALDFGAWLLIRFIADGSRRATWIPAERRGDPSSWHALRTALYGAADGRR